MEVQKIGFHENPSSAICAKNPDNNSQANNRTCEFFSTVHSIHKVHAFIHVTLFQYRYGTNKQGITP